jgi:DUF4097 and DUF4098 domain-containing protein YvlB
MHKSFSTPDPVSLFVELLGGDLVVRTGEVSETVVEVSGQDAEAVRVEQHGEEIMVLARPGGFFGSSPHVSVQVSLPHDSRLSAKLGSADVRVEGRLGASTVKAGSGDVQIEELGAGAVIETGSGDVRIDAVTGALKVKCGSGDVVLDRLDGHAEVLTGSGDVLVASAREALTAKSGSGDLRVREALEDVVLTTASGDLVVDVMHRGQLTARNVSGDIKVGIPGGIPVWTDITSTTGSVRSNLAGAGQPKEGQDFIELRAKTISGDVYLEQL